jgi:beta-glucosidase
MLGLVVSALAACWATAAGAGARAGVAPSRPWLDADEPVPARVEALLAVMTQDEKLHQLLRPEYSDALPGVGAALLEFTGLLPGCANATAVVKKRNAVQRAFLSAGPGARLGIPVAFRLLSIHGAEAFGTTFPEGPGLGATWDDALVRNVSAAMAVEARALGADMAFFVINLWADPRFGRQEEGFSEEPTLTSAMAAASVAGAQGRLGVGPCE